jgi:hypothetical protein
MILPSFRNIITLTSLISSSVTAQDLKYIAFGDSFAAGIGAGRQLQGNDDQSCSRTTGAYGQWLSFALRERGLGPGEFVACSGAKTSDVMSNQLSFMDDTVDLATISMG